MYIFRLEKLLYFEDYRFLDVSFFSLKTNLMDFFWKKTQNLRILSDH